MGEKLTVERVDAIIAEINRNPLLDGVTLSGGDPFYNPEGLISLLKRIKRETGMSVWCYTGFTLEEIKADSRRVAALDYIDVLVDGKFVQELYSPFLDFRGSSNQRILRLSK